MIEVAGLIFGGAARLVQNHLENKDKQNERAHEAVMCDKQIALQKLTAEANKDLKAMDIAASQDTGELNLLLEAMKSQSEEAKAAGGFVLKASALVRPGVAYLLTTMYLVTKCIVLYVAITRGASLLEVAREVYTEWDGALYGSVMAFYFADRSIAKSKGKV